MTFTINDNKKAVFCPLCKSHRINHVDNDMNYNMFECKDCQCGFWITTEDMPD